MKMTVDNLLETRNIGDASDFSSKSTEANFFAKKANFLKNQRIHRWIEYLLSESFQNLSKSWFWKNKCTR